LSIIPKKIMGEGRLIPESGGGGFGVAIVKEITAAKTSIREAGNRKDHTHESMA
jgi:hypothetical protein